MNLVVGLQAALAEEDTDLGCLVQAGAGVLKTGLGGAEEFVTGHCGYLSLSRTLQVQYTGAHCGTQGVMRIFFRKCPRGDIFVQ